jgi:alcohol dehydrogenase
VSYIWNIPTKVLFGPGQLNHLHEETMPGKKGLVVISNGTSAKVNGYLDRVLNELTTAGAAYVLFDKIEANPLEATIQQGVEMARQEQCDFVVGLGGGSVLDSATVIAAVAPQLTGRVWDYAASGSGGRRPLTVPSLPYIEITTSAGTGSEVDAWGVVSKPDTKEKIGFKGEYPWLAIVDPELMLTVPPAFTAYQGFDALFHSLEGYISLFCNEAAAMVELEAIRNVARYLPIAIKDGSNIEARTKMAFANTMSGYSMDLGSCTSEHAMEHALSGFHHDLPHGAGLIMISLAYFNYFVEKHVCDDRFITMAKAMGKENATKAEDFLTALAELQQACGVADLKMSDYGIRPDEFPAMAKNARATMGGLFLCDPTKLPEADVINIYEKSYR